VTHAPLGRPEPNPMHTLRNAALICALGVLVVLSASIDPWLLVMVGGLAVTFFVLTQESVTRPSAFPTWDAI